MLYNKYEKFARDFGTEEYEVIALARTTADSYMNYGENMRRYSVYTCAMTDCRTGGFSKEEGLLTWLDKDSGPSFPLKEGHVYRLKVRKAFEKEYTGRMVKCWYDNRYMVVSAREYTGDARMNELAEFITVPASLETPYGTLTLKRKWNSFVGDAEICGNTVELIADMDDFWSLTADNALKAITRRGNLAEFDAKAKAYAAEKLLEIANEWIAEDGGAAITRADFIQTIFLTGITAYKDGTAEWFYDDGFSDDGDGLFAGHVIVVSVDENGTFTDADIEG